MSAAKFDQFSYKLFDPGFHSQRPIIVDEELESPDTVTLAYEEEAAARSGGGGLSMSMAAYKTQPSQVHGFADSPYSQFSPQSFSSNPTDHATPQQINNLAFSSNNTASTGQYAANPPSEDGAESMARVVSGAFAYHLDDAHGHNGPLASSVGATSDFGQERSGLDIRHKTGAPAHVDRPSAPTPPATAQLLPQHYHQEEQQRPQNQSLLHLTSRTTDITSPVRHQHHDQQQQNEEDHLHHSGVPSDSNTNTYPYSPVAGATGAETQIPTEVQHMQNEDAADAQYSQENDDMLGSYRGRVSYADPYRPPSLRHSGGTWSAYGAAQDASERYDIVRDAALAHSHGSMMRQAITPSPRMSHHTDSSTSNLTRTSILAASTQSHGYGNGIYLNGWAGAAPPPRKAELIMRPDELNSMADINSWTQEEWANKRRIVVFTKKQTGAQLAAFCKPVPVGERPPNAICISCIWWAERKDCFVTSVDAIYLLERLIVPPRNNKFDVEEKNRIRRNLEGFKPITVSKNRRDSEDFFKLIMGFGNPKPRNIEKDVKVFSWKVLEPALRKIVSKYSYSPPPSATVAHAHHAAPAPLAPSHHLVTPVSLPALPAVTYPGLPPTPVSATTATDPAMASGYVSIGAAHTHLDHGLPSPRSLPPSSSWAAAYAPSTRALSPGLVKPLSPQPVSGLRLSTLSSIYGTARSPHPARAAGTYGLPQHTHTSPHHHHAYHSTSHDAGISGASRYGPYDVAAVPSYAVPSHHDTYSHSAAHQSQTVYGAHTGYGTDGGVHRA